MSDVQIPVGLRRKAGENVAVVFAGFQVFLNDVFNKVCRPAGFDGFVIFRIWVWCFHGFVPQMKMLDIDTAYPDLF